MPLLSFFLQINLSTMTKNLLWPFDEAAKADTIATGVLDWCLLWCRVSRWPDQWQWNFVWEVEASSWRSWRRMSHCHRLCCDIVAVMTGGKQWYNDALSVPDVMGVEGVAIRREEGVLRGKWLVTCFVTIQIGWVGGDRGGHWGYGQCHDGGRGIVGITLARVLGKAFEGQAMSGLVWHWRDGKGKPTEHSSRCCHLRRYLLYKVGCCLCRTTLKLPKLIGGTSTYTRTWSSNASMERSGIRDKLRSLTRGMGVECY